MVTQTPHPKDHDLLIEISTKLDLYIAQANSMLTDHEQRIRRVEQSIQKLKGAQWVIGGIATLATIIISIVQLFIH